MRLKKTFILIIIILFIFIVAQANEKQKVRWKGKIKIENGVKVIKNPKEPLYSEIPFVLKEELTIGDEEGEEYMFQEIWHVVVDDEENIYVPDSRAAHIKVFDKNGKYLRTIGRKGQGPGELGYPFGIQITPQKELLVNDRRQARLHFFTLDGKFLRQFSTSTMARFMLPKVDSKGNIIAGFMIPEDTIMGTVKKFDSELKPILTLVTIPTATQPPVINYFENQRLINLHWDVTKDDKIIWGDIRKYEFYVHTPEGRLIKKIVTDYDGIKITKGEKERLTREMFGDNPVPSRITLEFPKNLPPFRQFNCDEEGRIFVRSYETVKEGKGIYYDVFDTEGRYIARVPLEKIPRCWKNHKLYSTGEDEEGFMVVKRYNIQWK
ncbi:hypothetical protein ES702_04770 [subsurface metagenome]